MKSKTRTLIAISLAAGLLGAPARLAYGAGTSPSAQGDGDDIKKQMDKCNKTEQKKQKGQKCKGSPQQGEEGSPGTVKCEPEEDEACKGAVSSGGSQ